MTWTARLRFALVIVSALVVQTTLAPAISIDGVHPDVMTLLAVAASLEAGPEAAAARGFFIGLAEDLFLQTPFGLSALVYTVVGFAVGLAMHRTSQVPRSLATVVVTAASAGAAALFGVLASVMGTGTTGARLAAIAIVVGLTSGVLAVPALGLVRFATGQPLGRRATFAEGGGTAR